MNRALPMSARTLFESKGNGAIDDIVAFLEKIEA